MAESFSQKLHSCHVEKLRHLFEHELSQFAGEPHSPDQVKKRYEHIEPLISPDFRNKCLDLAKQIQQIRDSIPLQYPDCGKGVNRWKVSTGEDSTLGYNAQTMTASTIGYTKVYNQSNSSDE